MKLSAIASSLIASSFIPKALLLQLFRALVLVSDMI